MCGAYRGIKLLELGLKVFDRIMDRRITNKKSGKMSFAKGRC